MISMKKIAEICQVSPGTVSKTLSNSAGVSSKTRSRILEVARQFNYVPNALVRSIQSGQSKTVAVACNSIDDPWGSIVMHGILETLERYNLEALVFNWDSNVRDGRHILRSMGERRVDGLIMFPPELIPPLDYLEELRNFKRPVIVVDQRWPNMEFDFVGTDDSIGARALTEHIIELGHRKIANLHFSSASSGHIRLEEFYRVMGEKDVQINPQWVADSHANFEASYRQAVRWLSESSRPSAIICFNDLVAMAVLAAANDLKLHVPHELSITGFCDLPIASQVRPSLTTVKQNPVELGKEAAELLVREILERQEEVNEAKELDSLSDAKRKPHPRSVLLPTSIIVRQSTARASDG